MTLVTLAVVYAYFTKPKGDVAQTSVCDDVAEPQTQVCATQNKLKFVGHFLKSFTFWRSLILVVAAVPIAILTNALRVSGTGVLAHYYGTRVADGFFHSFSGWVIYVAAALLLFATGWVLDRFARFNRRDRNRIRKMNNISMHAVKPLNPV
jgi:exosortase/archaeosortase family protein